MRRRKFISLVGGTAASSLLWPLAAQAQSSRKPRRIAFVHSGIPADQLTEAAGPFWVRRFYETLRGLGDIEGGNLAVERYSAEGRAERFAALAAEVVSRNPEVIVTNLNDLAKAFMTATSTIPIAAITGDPLASGLITSLARPGGNMTGVSIDASPSSLNACKSLKRRCPGLPRPPISCRTSGGRNRPIARRRSRWGSR